MSSTRTDSAGGKPAPTCRCVYRSLPQRPTAQRPRVPCNRFCFCKNNKRSIIVPGARDARAAVDGGLQYMQDHGDAKVGKDGLVAGIPEMLMMMPFICSFSLGA
jgi:hypothetical protein